MTEIGGHPVLEAETLDVADLDLRRVLPRLADRLRRCLDALLQIVESLVELVVVPAGDAAGIVPLRGIDRAVLDDDHVAPLRIRRDVDVAAIPRALHGPGELENSD